MGLLRRILGTKKRTILVIIGFYLIGSYILRGILDNQSLKDVSNSWDRSRKLVLTGHDLTRFLDSNSNQLDLPFLAYNIQHNGVFTRNVSGTISKPCYSSGKILLDEYMKAKMRNKRMLSYFDTTSGYRLSVPDWQIKLRDAKRSEKYFLSSVVRLRLYSADKAKWTTGELKQWIHYQFWAGAEHIYICNHFLNVNEKIDSQLRKYVNFGIVTIIPWNNITAVPDSKTYETDNADNQIACYNHVLKLYGNQSVWQYNFDMDENPFVPGDYCEGFLVRFIRNMERKYANLAELRVSNYVLQGQGDRSRDLLYDRINRISPRPYNGNVKPIYKTSLTNEAGMHGAKIQGILKYPRKSELKMLHYWGARKQNWGPDSQHMLRTTILFNDVRDSLAVSVRHSLVSFGDLDAFNSTRGP